MSTESLTNVGIKLERQGHASALRWLDSITPKFILEKVKRLKQVGEMWRLWKNSDEFADGMYSLEISLQLFESIKKDFGHLLAEDEWTNFSDRIKLVFKEFVEGLDPAEKTPELAFCIHQREREADIASGNPYDDATAFSVEIKNLITRAQEKVSPEELVSLRKRLAKLIDTFPAFRAAVIDIKHKDESYRGAVICIPITVDDLSLSADTSAEEKIRIQNELISRVIVGLKFMKRLGIEHIGLGAVLPRITGMGELVRLFNLFEQANNLKAGKPSKNLEYTTGHGMTVALMIETMFVATEKHKLDVLSSTMAVIGCGYIGRSYLTSLYKINGRPLPRKVILYDVEIGKALKTKKLLEKIIGESQSQVEIIIKSPNSDPETDIRELIQESQIIIGAATHGRQIDYVPVDDAETKIFIDDSQPTLFARFKRSINDLNKHLYWPTAHAQNGYHRQAIDVEDGQMVTQRSSSYGEMGLVPAELVDFVTFWGCELENFLLFLLSKDGSADQFSKNAVQEAVTPSIVLRMRRLLERYNGIVGIQQDGLQSYGKLS